MLNGNVTPATKPRIEREESGRTSEGPAQGRVLCTCAKRSVRNYGSHRKHGVLEKHTRVLCEEHGQQAVTDYFKRTEGNLLRLAWGCDRHEEIGAAALVKQTIVTMFACQRLLQIQPVMG